MASSSQMNAGSQIPSASTPHPESQESQVIIDSRPEVLFNLNGVIIGGKNTLMKRCRALVKQQIGLVYNDWREVEASKKDDLWDTIIQEFRVPVERKEEVLSFMGNQLKTWRKNLRATWFANLDSNAIKAMKDKVPENLHIPLHHWNAFVNREASESKLRQREFGKVNRAKKTDVHCLGQHSYAEKSEKMVRR